MKKKNIIQAAFGLAICATILISGCTKLALQTSSTRGTTDTLDNHIYMTTWKFILSHSSYTTGRDTLFKTMHDAILYSGIDTNLYSAPNHTYFLLNAAAMKTMYSSMLINGKKATGYKSYSATDLKNYFLYLIVNGQYSHYNLPVNPVNVQTNAPAGTYTTDPATFNFPLASGIPTGTAIPSNPNSTMSLYVLNTSIGNIINYPIVVNMNIATTTTLTTSNYNYVTVYTSDIMATNGVVDVLNAVIWPVTYQ